MGEPLNKHDGTEVIINIPGEGVFLARGATIPSNSGSGYAAGCLYVQTGTPKLYINTGTLASSTWTVVGSQS